jgi:arylsulfatase A-like enzyme
MPESAYANARNAPHEKGSKTFSHALSKTADSKYYSSVVASGFGQEVIFDLTEKAIESSELGKDDVPDILVLNLASNDYVGHAWGPNSPEVMDISVLTDKMLSRLFNYLDKSVPGGIDNVAIVISADHGVCDIPSELSDVYKVESGRVSGSEILKKVDDALDAKFGAAKWTLDYNGSNIYLDLNVIAGMGLKRSDVEEVAAEAAATATGVYDAYSRTRVLEGRLPDFQLKEWITNGMHPTIGGDVVVITKPNYVETGATGTSHGSAWAYDTHVPILTHWGGQRPQVVGRRVYTHDIASTLSVLLGIEYPSGNVGQPLYEAFPVRR